MSRLLAVAVVALLGCGGPPRLKDVEAKVFTPSCALANCHGSTPHGVSLESPTWAKVVNVESGTARMPYVAPGKPDQSLIYLKLTKRPPPVGDRMPASGTLTSEQLELVRAWIEAGALND